MTPEKAILVNLSTKPREKMEAEESMEELAGLAAAAGAGVVRKIFQHRPKINPKYFIGRGKVEEIARAREELQADLIIFDHNLSPVQQRSLEDKVEAKVIDRTQLILDIFAKRARTNEGKLQVELAQLSYLLPRLVGKGIALSKLGAGIGTRGPGEKKLEEDRRRILDRIFKIKQEINRVQKRREHQRKSRTESPVRTVSLVGYTSAGKTTLFNRLSRESMLTSSQLFATLDPTLRRVPFPDGFYFFLIDTVGFIKKLPVELISSFRATLEEVREADCLLHVIDAATSQSRTQAEAVENILADLGAKNVPVIKAYNKVDLLPNGSALLAKNRSTDDRTVYLSAKTGEGVPELKEKLRSVLFQDLRTLSFRIPKGKEDLVSSLSRLSMVLKKTGNEGYWELKVAADPRFMLSFIPYLAEGEEK